MGTILVVQPDPDVQRTWAVALAGRDHAALWVSGVGDAIERAREGGIDLVVFDGGAEPAGRAGAVRELVAELERLPEPPPLVLVSGSPDGPELSAQIGAAGFLPHPCSTDDLVEVVDRVASALARVRPYGDEELTSPRLRDL